VALKPASTRPIPAQAEAAPCVVLTDAGGLTTWVGAAFTAATGYTLRDLRGRTPASVLRAPAAAGLPPTAHYRKDGTRYLAHWQIEAQRDATGQITGYVSLHTESSSDTDAELARLDAMQERAELHAIDLELRQLVQPQFGADGTMEAAVATGGCEAGAVLERQRIGRTLRHHRATQPDCSVGLFERDIDSDTGHADRRMCEIWGLAAGDELPSTAGWRSRVLPVDLPAFDRAWTQSIVNLAPASLDCRVADPDGTTRWLQMDWVVGRDGRGRRVANGSVRDITAAMAARLQTEQDLQHTQQQLRDLTAHQQDQFEALRSELARDLHDELGQTLGALALEIDLAQEAAPDSLQRMRSLLETGVALVRDVCRALRPAALDLGLLPALRALALEVSMRGDVDVVAVLPDTLPELPEPQVRALYRIAQEALTNATRHAAARHVEVQLLEREHDLTLHIHDDGCGFLAADGCNGLGLLGMRERARQIGAALSIHSTPGQGTTVGVELAKPVGKGTS
jgi:signal transduction histidine kinase